MAGVAGTSIGQSRDGFLPKAGFATAKSEEQRRDGNQDMRIATASTPAVAEVTESV